MDTLDTHMIMTYFCLRHQVCVCHHHVVKCVYRSSVSIGQVYLYHIKCVSIIIKCVSNIISMCVVCGVCSMLATNLNMSRDDAERWIVNLIRNAKLDAKIDAKEVIKSCLALSHCVSLCWLVRSLQCQSS